MKKILSVLFCAVLVLCADTNAQSGINVKRILDELGYTARAYLLSANRPSYGISTYTTPKGKFNIDIGAAFNNDFIEIPLSLSYGLSNKVELQTGIPVYTQSYNFAGKKIDGVGDANFGIKYKFQESDNFDHAFQLMVKIPTASANTELGTGKVDFHFSLAQGFYYKNFSYDFSAELNFLKRRDFPDLKNIPKLLQPAIDSIKNVYDYKYEREIALTLSPAYSISNRTVIYSGISFSRNFRLDYNSLQIFGGLGFSFSRIVSGSAGASYSLLTIKSWSISTGISLLL